MGAPIRRCKALARSYAAYLGNRAICVYLCGSVFRSTGALRFISEPNNRT